MPLRDHPFPQPEPAPTVFMLPGPLVPPSPALLASGASAVTRADNRWLRCDLKTTALLANVLLRQEAVDAGATETLLLRDGFLSEGSASNVFLVKNGVLLAPPKSNLMLPGVTYDVVLELAAANGVPSEVRPLTEAELRAADEVWMTSSTKEVLAITRLDGLPVGDGTPGPLAQRMHGLYQQFKQTVMRRADH
jgi:D-alanine transaminase